MESCNLLPDLPSELVELIAEHVPSESLLLLRLVNKEVASRTHRPMLVENFYNLDVRLSWRKSLENAISVSEHLMLRYAVRSLTFYGGRFDIKALHDHKFPGDTELGWMGGESAVAAHRKTRARIFGLIEDAEELEQMDVERDSLLALFWNFEKVTSALVVNVLDMGEYDTEYLPDNDVFRMCCEQHESRGFLTSGIGSDSPLLGVLSAMEKSGIRLGEFTAGAERSAVSLYMSDWIAGWDSLRNFERLTSLSLAFQDHIDTHDLERCVRYVNNFITFHRAVAPRLSHLELTTIEGGSHGYNGRYPGLMTTVFEAMCQKLTLPVL